MLSYQLFVLMSICQRHWICSCQPLETARPFYGAMVERHDGPSWLRDDDDDDVALLQQMYWMQQFNSMMFCGIDTTSSPEDRAPATETGSSSDYSSLNMTSLNNINVVYDALHQT